jgi:hypothetical protein
MLMKPLNEKVAPGGRELRRAVGADFDPAQWGVRCEGVSGASEGGTRKAGDSGMHSLRRVAVVGPEVEVVVVAKLAKYGPPGQRGKAEQR